MGFFSKTLQSFLLGSVLYERAAPLRVMTLAAAALAGGLWDRASGHKLTDHKAFHHMLLIVFISKVVQLPLNPFCFSKCQVRNELT